MRLPAPLIVPGTVKTMFEKRQVSTPTVSVPLLWNPGDEMMCRAVLIENVPLFVTTLAKVQILSV